MKVKSRVVKEWLRSHCWQNSDCVFLNSVFFFQYTTMLLHLAILSVHVYAHIHIHMHMQYLQSLNTKEFIFVTLFVFQKSYFFSLKQLFQAEHASRLKWYLSHSAWLRHFQFSTRIPMKPQKRLKHNRENQDCLSTHCQNLGDKPAVEKDNRKGLKSSPQPAWAQGLETRTRGAWAEGRPRTSPPPALSAHTSSSFHGKSSPLSFYSTATVFLRGN